MGRFYRFSKNITEAQAREIEREMKELTTAECAEVTEDNKCLKVVTEEEKYPEVMGKAVNISASQDFYTSKPEKIEGVHETVEPTRPVSRESVEIGRKCVPLPQILSGQWR